MTKSRNPRTVGFHATARERARRRARRASGVGAIFEPGAAGARAAANIDLLMAAAIGPSMTAREWGGGRGRGCDDKGVGPDTAQFKPAREGHADVVPIGTGSTPDQHRINAAAVDRRQGLFNLGVVVKAISFGSLQHVL